MAVTLAANQIPAGTRPGSPIKIVDTFTDAGQTKGTASFPVSEKAQPNDVVLAAMGFAGTGSSLIIPGSFVLVPTGMFVNDDNIQNDTNPNSTQMTWYRRVVQANDPGTEMSFKWNAPQYLAWGLVVYTLRYVNTGSIYDGGFNNNSSAGPTLNFQTSNPGPVTGVANALLISAMTIFAGNTNLGISVGPLPGWYDTIQVGVGQPGFALVSGVVDMPVSGSQWQGAQCQVSQGSGSVSGVFAALTASIRPMPAPVAPSFYLNPSAGSVDAAGTSGRQLTAHWGYTPANGQGQQLSWLFVRQTTGGSITQFWSNDVNGWVSAETFNDAPKDQRSFTFPTGAWLNDSTQWNCWMAITESALFLKSALAGPLTFTTLAPPAVTGVTVTNSGTTTPTIHWTEALTNSPQVAYRVRVFSSDQLALPGFDPSNILVDDDSDFELSIGTWTGAGSTVQLGAAHNFTGGGDLFMQALGTTGVGAFSGSYPVTPGVAYRSIAYSWADATPRSMTLRIIWQDANGNQIATSSGTPATDSTTVWTQLTVAGTAPTGAVTARIFAFSTVSAVNEVHRLDQVHFAATPQPKWASGVVLSTALSATTAALAPSVQYTAYVEVLQTNDQWTPVSAVTNGAYVNSPTATWFAGLTAAPVPAPAALTAVVGG